MSIGQFDLTELSLKIKDLKRWWQIRTGRVDTPFDGEGLFWIASFFVHLAVLIFLAAVIVPTPKSEEVKLVLDAATPAVDIEELPPEIEFEEDNSEIGADSDNGFELAADEAPEVALDREDAVEIDMVIAEEAELLTDDDVFEPTNETFSTVAVKGSVGHSVTGATGAVDRITQEIMQSLDERKTLVVWMFDQSASLMQQRDEIRNRIDVVYEELGMLEEAGKVSLSSQKEAPLLTQVVAFGKNARALLDKPTNDLQKIRKALNSIEVDRSGFENVFSATIQTVDKYKYYRKTDPRTRDIRRNVMIIVVSDEAGDDGNKIDECVASCTRYEIPVYVIGIPAPFGRQETKVKWVDPDPQFDQTPQMASVSQGPETLALERIRLDFSGNFDDLDSIDSGFGPFNLTRLCYETGGIYFAVHPNRRTHRAVRHWETSNYSAHLSRFFDPEAMRPYKPDYVSRATYFSRLNENRSRAALVEAARFTGTGVLERPQLRFPKFDEAQFVRNVSNAQRAAARVEPQLDKLYEMLRSGEQDRKNETSLRWQAGYDLAYGRAIAARVRAASYNQMLAIAKTKLKFDPPKNEQTPQNNTWVLKPADSIETGSQQAKLAAKAKNYLQRVVDSHPNTPWSMLAKRELQTPIGWKWNQTYQRPPRERQRQMVDNGNRQPRPPQPNQNQMPRQRRPPPKL